MKLAILFMALFAMVGGAFALNPQPEPPAQILEELGKIKIVDNSLVIDLGSFPDIATAEQNIRAVLDVIQNTPISQAKVVIVANGLSYSYDKNSLGQFKFAGQFAGLSSLRGALPI